MSKNTNNIIEELSKLIESGEYKVNHKLPSEIKMAKYFNVSRMTYRSAVKKLQEEGKLYVKNGSGTYVTSPLPKIESSIEKLESTGKMIRKAGFHEDERREKLEIINSNKEISEILKIRTNSKVVVLKRFRIADNKAIAYSINYMPYSIVGKAFEKEKFSGSLFNFLEKFCKIEIKCADSEFCVADEKDKAAKKLHIKNNKRVMLIKQLHYTLDNIPILYSDDYLRNDIFNFKIRRKK